MKKLFTLIAIAFAMVFTGCGGETGNVINPNIQQARAFQRQAEAQERAANAEERTAKALERIANALEKATNASSEGGN